MKKSIVFRQPGTPKESVLVGLDMSGYYKEFINAIPDGAKNREEKFKNGVACIVWGSFYLETAINDTVVKILEDGTSGMLQGEEMVWPLLEKVKTEQKFELILAALMPDDEKKRDYSKSVAAIFKLQSFGVRSCKITSLVSYFPMARPYVSNYPAAYTCYLAVRHLFLGHRCEAWLKM